eukprot:scaffold149_cov179-Amphora_coffeaeformis.AAC.12
MVSLRGGSRSSARERGFVCWKRSRLWYRRETITSHDFVTLQVQFHEWRSFLIPVLTSNGRIIGSKGFADTNLADLLLPAPC